MKCRRKLSVASILAIGMFFSSNGEEVLAEDPADDYELFDPEEEGYDVIEPLDNPDEVLNETMELPEIHENTIIYNGTISPEFNFSLTLPDGETLEEPYINDAGQFSLTFFNRELQAGDEVVFNFNVPSTDGTYENAVPVEVLPEETGMEIVESSADTQDIQNSILEATEFDWHDSGNIVNLNIDTVGDMDGAPFYTVNDDPITEEKRLEHIQENQFRAHLSEESISIGDTVTVYIVASGVTTPLEVEVPDTLESLQQAEGTESEEEPDETEDDVEDDTESEEDIDTEDDQEDDEEVEEIDPPEVEDTEDEADDGMSIGWILIGIVVLVAIIGGIAYAVKRKNNHNNTEEDELE